MATDVSIKLGVTGESDLTSALKGVESRIKNLNSEMKAAVSSMSGLENAEQQAAKKSDILTRSIDATKDKIGILSQQYDKAKAKLDELGTELENARQQFGENSAEALRAEAAYNRQAVTVNNLGTKINNATADMNKMEAELRDLGNDANRAGDGMDRLGDDADQAGNAFQQLGDKISRQEAELNGLFLAMYSVIGFLALLAGGFVYYHLDTLFGASLSSGELARARIMTILLVLNISLTFPFSIFASIMQAYERFVYLRAINILRSLLMPAIMVPLLLVGYGSVAMVAVSVGLNVACLLLNVYYCCSRLDVHFARGHFDRAFLQEIAGYSFPISY